MRYLKPVAAAVALAVGASTLVGPAEAGYGHHHRHHHGDGAELAVAGIFGLAAGALLGSALAQPEAPRYYYDPAYAPAPPPPVVYQDAASLYGGPAPWTQAWYDYCSQFPSFDPRTGYVYGADGAYHFCR